MVSPAVETCIMFDAVTEGAQFIAPYCLAFETSSDVGSIALGRGLKLLEARSLSGNKTHATELLPTVDALCRTHDVEPGKIGNVFVSIGPGSFTGLRIGLTAARMIALAGGARLVAVPTLEAIAHNALEASPSPASVAVILDAKRGRVYSACFAREQAGYVSLSAPAEVDPAEFLARRDRSCAVLGEGVLQHGAVVEASGLRTLPETLHRPRAEVIYRLGAARAQGGSFDDPRTLVPLYVRPPEAEEKWDRRHAPGSG